MLIYSFLQINLPDSVTKRFYHSMSTYYISKERFWIIVTGGACTYNVSDGTSINITGPYITMIIELGMIIIIIMFTGMCTIYDIHDY